MKRIITLEELQAYHEQGCKFILHQWVGNEVICFKVDRWEYIHELKKLQADVRLTIALYPESAYGPALYIHKAELEHTTEPKEPAY